MVRKITEKSVKYLGLAVAIGLLFVAVCVYAESDSDAAPEQGTHYLEIRDKHGTPVWGRWFSQDVGFIVLPNQLNNGSTYERAYLKPDKTDIGFGAGTQVSVSVLIDAAGTDNRVTLYVMDEPTGGTGQGTQYRLEIRDRGDEYYWDCLFMSTDGKVTLPSADKVNMSSYTVYLNKNLSGNSYGPGETIPVETLIGMAVGNSVTIYISGGTEYEAYIFANNPAQESFGPIYVYGNTLNFNAPTLAGVVSTGWKNGDKIPSHLNTKANGSGKPFQFGNTHPMSDLTGAADINNVIRVYLIWKDGELPEAVPYTLVFKSTDGTETYGEPISFTWLSDEVRLPSPGNLGMSTYTAYLNAEMSGDSYRPNDSISAELLIDKADPNKCVTVYITGEPGGTDVIYHLQVLDKYGGFCWNHDFRLTDTGVTLPADFYGSPYTIYLNANLTGESYGPNEEIPIGVLKSLVGQSGNTATVYVKTGTSYTLEIREANGNCRWSGRLESANSTFTLPVPDQLRTSSYRVYLNADLTGDSYGPRDEISVDLLTPLLNNGIIVIYVDIGTQYWLEIRDKWGEYHWDTTFRSLDETVALPPSDIINMSPYTVYLNAAATGESYTTGSSIPVSKLTRLADGNKKVVIYVTGGTEYEMSIHANNSAQDLFGPVHIYGNTLNFNMPTLASVLKTGWTNGNKIPSHFGVNAEGSGTTFQFGTSVPMDSLINAAANNNVIALYVIWKDGEVPPAVEYTLVFMPVDGVEACYNKKFTWIDDEVKLPEPNEIGMSWYEAFLDEGTFGKRYGPRDHISAELLISEADGNKRVTMHIRGERLDVTPGEGGETQYILELRNSARMLVWRSDPYTAADGSILLPPASQVYMYSYKVYFNEHRVGDSYGPYDEIPVNSLIPNNENIATLFIEEEQAPQAVHYSLEIRDKWDSHYWSTSFMSTEDVFILPAAEEINMSSYTVYLEANMSGSGYGPGSEISVEALMRLADNNNKVIIRLTAGTEYQGYVYANNPGKNSLGPMYLYGNMLNLDMPTLAGILETEWTNGTKIPSHFNTKADNSGVTFQFGALVPMSDLIAVAENKVLKVYVIWKDGELPPEVEYTLAFKYADGTKAHNDVTFTWRNDRVRLPLADDVNMNYYVAFFNADGSGKGYKNYDDVPVELLISEADGNNRVTVYLLEPSYTIVWMNGDTEFESVVLSHGERIERPLTNPTKPDDSSYSYRFVGWKGYANGAVATGDKTFAAIFDPILKNVDQTGTSLKFVQPDSQTVILSKNTVSQLKAAVAGKDKKVSFELSHGKIEMDSASVGSLASGDHRVELRKLTRSEISQEVAEKVGDFPVYSVRIGNIHEFGGKLTISLKYELRDGENAEDVRIWHIKEDGSYDVISCTYTDGYATFETSHLSYYAVTTGSAAGTGGASGTLDGMGLNLRPAILGTAVFLIIVVLAAFFARRR